MTVEGKLHVKNDTQQIKDTFKKREFVLEFADNPMYPQYILFQLIQDKCELLDQFEVGLMISVDFNLRGRAWNSPSGETKYFNSLDAWRVTPQQVNQPVGPAGPPPTPPAEAMDVTQMDEDDLPF
mgnify:CR=1 FL=1